MLMSMGLFAGRVAVAKLMLPDAVTPLKKYVEVTSLLPMLWRLS